MHMSKLIGKGHILSMAFCASFFIVTHSFDYFSVGLFVFSLWIPTVYMLDANPYQLNILQIFWSICSLFSHSFNGAI